MIATSQGQLVIKIIIPAIAALRQQYRFTYTTMFSHFLFSGKPGQSSIEVGDIKESDDFFDSLVFK